MGADGENENTNVEAFQNVTNKKCSFADIVKVILSYVAVTYVIPKYINMSQIVQTLVFAVIYYTIFCYT